MSYCRQKFFFRGVIHADEDVRATTDESARVNFQNNANGLTRTNNDRHGREYCQDTSDRSDFSETHTYSGLLRALCVTLRDAFCF